MKEKEELDRCVVAVCVCVCVGVGVHVVCVCGGGWVGVTHAMYYLPPSSCSPESQMVVVHTVEMPVVSVTCQ